MRIDNESGGLRPDRRSPLLTAFDASVRKRRSRHDVRWPVVPGGRVPERDVVRIGACGSRLGAGPCPSTRREHHVSSHQGDWRCCAARSRSVSVHRYPRQWFSPTAVPVVRSEVRLRRVRQASGVPTTPKARSSRATTRRQSTCTTGGARLLGHATREPDHIRASQAAGTPAHGQPAPGRRHADRLSGHTEVSVDRKSGSCSGGPDIHRRLGNHPSTQSRVRSEQSPRCHGVVHVAWVQLHDARRHHRLHVDFCDPRGFQ